MTSERKAKPENSPRLSIFEFLLLLARHLSLVTCHWFRDFHSMNSLERVRTVLAGGIPDLCPCACTISCWPPEAGVRMEEYRVNPQPLPARTSRRWRNTAMTVFWWIPTLPCWRKPGKPAS